MARASTASPGRDCPRCPRLADISQELARQGADLVQRAGSFVRCLDARLLIVGLAPGVQGANRTGRPFTGDYAGVLLYETLASSALRAVNTAHIPTMGLNLIDCRITNAVRCVPPENKPTPEEIRTCRDFLDANDRRNEKTARGRCARPYCA